MTANWPPHPVEGVVTADTAIGLMFAPGPGVEEVWLTFVDGDDVPFTLRFPDTAALLRLRALAQDILTVTAPPRTTTGRPVPLQAVPHV